MYMNSDFVFAVLLTLHPHLLNSTATHSLLPTKIHHSPPLAYQNSRTRSNMQELKYTLKVYTETVKQ